MNVFQPMQFHSEAARHKREKISRLNRVNRGPYVTLGVTCLDLTSVHIEAAVFKCCDILVPKGKHWNKFW